jgi:hypothetical protein
MLKIAWKNRVINQRVLERMGKEKELLIRIKARKLEYIGHIINNQRYNIIQLILQGSIEVKSSVGRRGRRPRIFWMKNFRDWHQWGIYGGVQGYWTPQNLQKIKNEQQFLHICRIGYVKHSQGS